MNQDQILNFATVCINLMRVLEIHVDILSAWITYQASPFLVQKNIELSIFSVNEWPGLFVRQDFSAGNQESECRKAGGRGRCAATRNEVCRL